MDEPVILERESRDEDIKRIVAEKEFALETTRRMEEVMERLNQVMDEYEGILKDVRDEEAQKDYQRIMEECQDEQDVPGDTNKEQDE